MPDSITEQGLALKNYRDNYDSVFRQNVKRAKHIIKNRNNIAQDTLHHCDVSDGYRSLFHFEPREDPIEERIAYLSNHRDGDTDNCWDNYTRQSEIDELERWRHRGDHDTD